MAGIDKKNKQLRTDFLAMQADERASISPFPGFTGMLARILLIEFGVFLLGLTVALGYQIAQRLHTRGASWPAESLMLLAAAVGVGGNYLKLLVQGQTAVPGMMPALSHVWVEVYAVCSVLYLLAKGLRVWRLKKI